MMAAEENWREKLSTIAERTKFIFNSELLSDVKFVVAVSTDESESKKVIPAHKFVLALSSPVFFAMFYGQMAETGDAVSLPDCEYGGLLELFRFLYSDEVNLSGSNVMQVLYLAKKYMVPPLAEKCREYLQDNLTTSNVVSILPHAQTFEDKDLEERWWEMIGKQTKEVVASDEFDTVDRSLIESVVKKDELNVTEVELFKVVDHWATKECERQGLTSDGETKRRILGEDVVKEIRFPLMSDKEFASFVLDSNILTPLEVAVMVKHYTGVLPEEECLPFSQALRRVGTIYGRWSYNRGNPDRVNFIVNNPIKLSGIEHFGSEGGQYTVSTRVNDPTSNVSVVKRSGTYTSEWDNAKNFYGFDVLFDHPVRLEANKQYELVSLIKGPVSWYGEGGQTSIKSGGVRFTFTRGKFGNGTTHQRGQFPALIFS
ncbi:BTB/POZ domain-containing protein 6-like [Stylophora pistillata]|uniref:BTB/POZ domain-containing protein 6-like n=1 Tax=Stylophora pistillata TaxID=50429 RepID=UPI000C039F3B|nr:BTB/POZ domain-containing protein 6-like [Stylophora pistillata]